MLWLPDERMPSRLPPPPPARTPCQMNGKSKSPTAVASSSTQPFPEQSVQARSRRSRRGSAAKANLPKVLSPSGADVASKHPVSLLTSHIGQASSSHSEAAVSSYAIERLQPIVGRDGVVRYAIAPLLWSDSSRVVSRRYSEWHTLREELPLTVRGALSAPFPPKRWVAPFLCSLVSSENHPAVVIEERVAARVCILTVSWLGAELCARMCACI